MNLFQSLHQATEAAPLAMDLAGRAFMPYLGIVTQLNDPKSLRRIRVSMPNAPTLETDWLRRLLPYPNYDPPLPPVGSTVLVLSIDGQPTNGWYCQCVNLVNPPSNKADSVNDLFSRVPGEQIERTDRARVINVGSSLTLAVDSGASIVLAADGSVRISDATGHSITLDNGITVQATSLKVGSKEIATVDALDDQGHSLVTRGW